MFSFLSCGQTPHYWSLVSLFIVLYHRGIFFVTSRNRCNDSSFCLAVMSTLTVWHSQPSKCLPFLFVALLLSHSSIPTLLLSHLDGFWTVNHSCQMGARTNMNALELKISQTMKPCVSFRITVLPLRSPSLCALFVCTRWCVSNKWMGPLLTAS